MKTIYERRAVRKYKKTAVSRDIIEQLIAAGSMAPSAMNKQSWKFYVLTNKATIHSFSTEIAHAAFKEVKHTSITDAVKMSLSFFHLSTIVNFITSDDHIFYGAPVVILITAPKADDWSGLNTGMCAQNIMLAAKAMGLDTCPVGFARLIMQTKDYASLNIPDTEMVELAITVGYGDEHPAAHERVKNNVHFVN
ncbi:MAG: nitroreductase [Bacteroidetes bacterium]|nr:nitroreductase [Bacteroidota bacterium]